MSQIDVEVEPGEVGFDPDRLARINRHFERYVDDGLLPGFLVSIARHGKVAHLHTYGPRDVEAGLPVERDTLFRIYSMTKPITSVAAMLLHEVGGFELKDPVAKYLPAFESMRVYRAGSSANPATSPASETMKVWHLLTHTSGLTYGFHHAHPVDAMYRNAGFEWGSPPGADLETCCNIWARQPLVFEPGTEWNYGVSTDVLGRLVEVVAGQPLDQVLQERLFDPLGMTDTGFFAPESEHGRLAALYVPTPGSGKILRMDAMGDAIKTKPVYLSGGGGLVSTAADYHRFTQMLANCGELDGERILAPRTVRYMTQNHLPGGADLEAFGRPLFAETTFDGVGFGLGFSVVDDPVKNKVPGSVGEFSWGGAASTVFWVDPLEDLTVTFLTQLLPSSTHPIRSQLKQLVHQSLC